MEGVYLGLRNGYKTRGKSLIVCGHLVGKKKAVGGCGDGEFHLIS